jgi:hypothetical protein
LNAFLARGFHAKPVVFTTPKHPFLLEFEAMSTVVLSADWATYSSGAYWADTNPWGKGNLINGIDYTQTIALDPATFPNGTILSWSWPSTYAYYGYPEVIYGSDPYYPRNPAVSSTQVANFTNLSTTYSISVSGNTNSYDTIFDMWLTSQPYGGPNTREYEIEIVAQRPTNWGPSPSHLAYMLTDSTLTNAAVYVNPGYSSGGDTWTNITIMPQAEMLSGTISISDILKSLIWSGVITGQEYLSGVAFGAEPQGGAGSVAINDLSYQWTGTPTIEGTASNDVFDITTPGGNNVVGNGGVDTVAYDGLYSQFQIKSLGSETLVMENNNVSTLDYLNGIDFIRFSDGTYNATTSTFTPAGQVVTPTVSSIVESPASGDLDAGETVTVTVNMSENVTVSTAGGRPTLTLNDGGTATYTGGSGTSALTFSYTVGAGQNAAALMATSVNLSGATIQDGAGNAANLSLSGLTQTGPQIDTTPPGAPIIASESITGQGVDLNGTAESTSVVSVYDGNKLLGTTSANSTGTWVFETPPLAEGEIHTFTATATDAAGNISASSRPVDPSLGVVLNSTAEPTGIVSAADGNQLLSAPSPQFDPSIGAGLLAHYMASSFAPAMGNHGGMTMVHEASQTSSGSWLAIPPHA